MSEEASGGIRERKKVATREALGLAALELAAERGLDEVRIDDIAAKAGVSPRTFNNYVSSKEEAIVAIGADRTARIVALLEGADTRYDMGAGDAHPWVGRWVPELRLTTRDGLARPAELLRTGRPVLLDFTAGQTAARAAEGWGDRVELVPARLEEGPAPVAAFLLRPGGHVAWAAASDEADPGGLQDALRRWCGEPRASSA